MHPRAGLVKAPAGTRLTTVTTTSPTTTRPAGIAVRRDAAAAHRTKARPPAAHHSCIGPKGRPEWSQAAPVSPASVTELKLTAKAQPTLLRLLPPEVSACTKAMATVEMARTITTPTAATANPPKSA